MRHLLVALSLLFAAGTTCSEPDPSAQRLLSLSPGLTETLYALDLGEQLIGRSDFCDYPPRVLGLPSAGTAMTPNFEKIAALQPTLILTESNAGSSMFELQQLGGLMAMPWLTLPDMVDGIRALGARFDRAEQAENLAHRLLSRLDVAVAESAPRLLLVLGGQVDGSPIWYIRRNSLHGAAMRAAGARNAVARDINGSASLSIEGLLSVDPEVIIVMLGQTEPAAEARERLRRQFASLPTLRAVKQQQIGVITDPGLMRTGPRILDFADALAVELALVLDEGADAVAGQ